MTTMAPRHLLARRLRRRELVTLDSVLAVVLVLGCTYAASEAPVPVGFGFDEPLWLSVLAGLLVGGPLAVRRLWPVPVALVILTASAAAALTTVIPNYASGASSVSLGFALYLVGVAEPLPRGSIVAVACVVVLSLSLAVGASSIPADLGGIAFSGFILSTSWLLGRAARERRAYAAQTAEHLAQRAVDDERLRLVRDLHDIVAHSMSLIAVKAAVANHVADADPDEARDALRVIEATSRSALLDIRQALGVLRDKASYSPAPGVHDLAAIADSAAVVGVDVDLVVEGDDALPEAVGVSVFRIVQESLTNVVKHAAPARCKATITVDPREVRIEVLDDGRRSGNEPAAGGQGLIGMRERVGIYGGDFSAGPRPEGGFVVRARLPYGSIA